MDSAYTDACRKCLGYILYNKQTNSAKIKSGLIKWENRIINGLLHTIYIHI